MHGVALMEGLPSRLSEVRHASLLVVEDGELSYFDFCGRVVETKPAYDADMDFGLYWPVPDTQIIDLKNLFKVLIELPKNRIHFTKDTPPRPPSATAAAFRDIVEGKEPEKPLQLSCLSILTNALFCSRIFCPFEDIESLYRTQQLRDAVRQAAPVIRETWQTHPHGLVWRCPNAYVDYEIVAAGLLEALRSAAPGKMVAKP